MQTIPHGHVDLGSRVVEVTPDMTFEPGDILGGAEFLGYVKIHSDEWHASRALGYGGSDVAAICGFSKWTSIYTLWAERVGKIARIDDGSNAEAKLLGSLLEPVILGLYASKYPGVVVVSAPAGYDMRWRSLTNAKQLAQPDALIFDLATSTWRIGESKTARYDDEWKDEERRYIVPEYYRTQVAWYHDAFQFEEDPIVLALFTGQDYREIPVHIGAEEIALNRKLVEEFDVWVVEEIEPTVDGSESTYTSVRRQVGDIDATGVAELGELWQPYADKKALLKQTEEEVRQLAGGILKRMGNRKTGYVGDQKVVRLQSNKGGPAFLYPIAK